MTITAINHINIEINSAQLPEVKSFYEQVLGLKPGFRTQSKRDGAWLYAGDLPIIHLSVQDSPLTAQGTHFNHMAFSCQGLQAAKAGLDERAIPYRLEQRSLQDKEMTQIFLHDPVGIKIELNFAGEILA